MRSKVTSLAAVPTENLIHVVMIEVNNADYILPWNSQRHRIVFYLAMLIKAFPDLSLYL